MRGLESSGYVVDSVARGDDAIFQLKLYDYDVAVIDWRMPGKEGIEVVAWARGNQKPTAILMLTARDAPPDRIRGLDTGLTTTSSSPSISVSSWPGFVPSSAGRGPATALR